LKGDELSAARIERGSRATAMAWHPTRSSITCGWETGDVTVHDVLPTASLVSAVKLPLQLSSAAAKVVATIWTSDGSRLLTGFAVSQSAARLLNTSSSL